MEMHQVQIRMDGSDDGSWRQRCYDRMERLKAREFPQSEEPASQPTILQQELFWEKNSEIFELKEAVQQGNVERFVDKLEQLSSENKLPLSAIFDQVTRAGDSLLHVAACLGKAEIAELIAHHFPDLLTKTNMKGDTSLHVAARGGRAGVMKLILSQYAAHKSTSSRKDNKDEEITRMPNTYGNTALHETVDSKDVEGVALLFEADKYVTHYLNKSDKSPLYLAILSSSKDMVNILLEAPFPDDKSLPKCHGNSPLHAAIYTKNTDLVKEIVEKRPDLMFLRDEYEGTPLHYAAATGYAKGIHLLENKSTVTALEWNSEGQLPIHLACKFGHIEVLKEFLQQEWADPKILLNKEGQNILHVAAENGRENVVQYLLKITKIKQLSINEKDNNGNTPLHLAAKNSHCSILLSLTEEKNIDVNLMNNEGLTARDIISLKNTPMTYKQSVLNAILISAGAQMSGKAKGKLSKFEDRITAKEEGSDEAEGKLSKSENKITAKEEGSGEAEGKLSKSENKITAKEEGLKNRIDSMMVVATLIVTITFAAGITIPGGLYGSDDPNPRKRGMPVFAKRTEFRFFILWDIVAMCSSTVGATILLVAQLVGDFDLGMKLIWIASSMLFIALDGMMGAFLCAVYLVVSDVFWLKHFSDFFLSVSLLLLFFVLPMYIVCWIVLGRFTLSIYWVCLVLRRAFRLFRIKAGIFGYVPHY